jgi:hypothetical protein
MKLSDETIKKIETLLTEGWSSRKIATVVGCGKSVVNNYRRLLNIPKPVSNIIGAKIAILDLETAAATALTFSRFNVNLGQNNIIKEGNYILCACWRWLGETEVHSVYLTPEEIDSGDDSSIVAAMFDVYENADAVVAHNGQKFDDKIIKARALVGGFPPLPKVKVLDTLKLAKKHMRLPSNRLDSIGEILGLGRKIDTGGISLWAKVQAGDVEAMAQMVTYCEQDVNLLYEVYLKLRAFGDAGTDFNAALYHGDSILRCRTCGSPDVSPTGRTVKTGVSSFAEYRCGGCGAVHRSRENDTTKEKRSGLLT